MTYQESIAAGLPLDQSHVDAANMLLELEKRTLPVLHAIKDCGLDCSGDIATIQQRGDFARAYKRNFLSDVP